MKKIVWIDLDGVLVDLDSEIDQFMNIPHLLEKYKDEPDNISGIFRSPPPIEGAIESVWKLHDSGKYNLCILTSAPWGNPMANMDKRLWVEDHFGDLFKKRMIITHLKDYVWGDYLIDDRLANGAGNFGNLTNHGTHLHFGTEKFPDWDSILKFLL